MKKVRILFVIICVGYINIYQVKSQGVAINDNAAAPNSNAILDIDISTNDKGILIPRITETQKLAMTLTSTEEGLMVYQTDQQKGFWHWTGVSWKRLLDSSTSSAASFGVMYRANVSDTTSIGADGVWYTIHNYTAGAIQNMQKSGDTLIVQEAGFYLMMYSVSGYSTQKQNYEYGIFVNGVLDISSELEQRIDTKINKESSVSGQTVKYLAVNDKVFISAKSDHGGGGGLVVSHGNVSLLKIGN